MQVKILHYTFKCPLREQCLRVARILVIAVINHLEFTIFTVIGKFTDKLFIQVLPSISGGHLRTISWTLKLALNVLRKFALRNIFYTTFSRR